MSDSYEGWAIVELFGRTRHAGKVSQVEQFGTAMLRLDVPGEGDTVLSTHFYGGSAIYCLTPTSEDVARKIAAYDRPAPVTVWELNRGQRDRDDDDQDEF